VGVGSLPCVTFEDRRMAFVPCSFHGCLGREMVVGIRGIDVASVAGSSRCMVAHSASA